MQEEPRLREQDWGNWQDRDDVRLQKAYRDAYGHFFYRFAQGESGADVYDRVGAFLESLHRSFEAPDHPPNVLLVTHGLTMRLFCMRWFHWSVAEFESLSNPGQRGDRGRCCSGRTAATRSTGPSSAGATRSRTASPDRVAER